MRVLIIGKYPPIEGGVSAHTYWLARGLGEAGHHVSVVTNAGRVEEAYREKFDLHDAATRAEYKPKNVSVFSLSTTPPAHIPFSEGYVTRLVNLGLYAIAEHGADVIYTHYLEPYAVAGFMLKQLTGLPLVVRHAGSDIYRLLKSSDYSYALGRVLKNADALLMSSTVAEVARSLGVPKRRIYPIPSRALPPQFSPEGPRFDINTLGITPDTCLITYLGKASAHKAIPELFQAVTPLKNTKLLFVSKGNSEKLRTLVQGGTRENVIFHDFVAPWVVPEILRASNLFVHLENNFPIPIHTPTQPYEGIACGTPLLLSREMHDKVCRMFPKTHDLFSVVEDPQNVDELRGVIERILRETGTVREKSESIRREFAEKNDWDAHTASHVAIFKDAIKRQTFAWRLARIPRYLARGGGL